MNYIYGLLLVLLSTIACTDDLADLSFASAENIPAPSEISALLTVTQDNSGMVTITPTGNNANSFEIGFGDEKTETATVASGESTTHTYAEGSFEITVTAMGLNDLTATANIPLNLSFRAPENLEIKAEIDASNPFKLNVSATADYAAAFHVYFDTSNTEEAPTALGIDAIIGYEYPTVGDYTIKVVALSGGSETIETTQKITVSAPTNLPIDFEIFDASVLAGFDGGVMTVIDNPSKNEDNNSDKVGQIVKNAGQPWGGNIITLSEPIDFSTKKFIKMNVWSPRAGGKMLFKVENIAKAEIAYEQEVVLTGNSAWEEVTIDYSDIDVSKEYQKVILIFDNGTMGDGSLDFTFYVDNIKLASQSTSGGSINFPMSFEIPFETSSFDGGNISIIDNTKTDGNSSTKVAKLVKDAGQVWAGSKITVPNVYQLETDFTVTLNVWSPRADLSLLMKFEDAVGWPNTTATPEITATTTKANEWETLTFNFSGIDTSIDFNNLVLIMDNGAAGDGSDNYTIYLDDISIASFLDFEPQQALSSFDGGEISIIDNTKTTGNDSSKIIKLVKDAGQVWAGSKITVSEPYILTESTTIKLKVWSPRSGLNLLMKFEDAIGWPNTTATAEITATTTKADEWEELTFTFPTIDTSIDFTNLVLIMDNGAAGDGSDNYTIYIDDITKL
ncbi:hypothetical protein [Flavicella sediminum]|uniref:hypothetical protein n=1 Tax=Flavicella sediminum TaxID=2585141 RepID=UPI001122B6BB|nr:hypothetical protein [Flavicella sediminum]